MDDQADDDPGAVTVSMEIAGPYEDVLSRLKYERSAGAPLKPFVHDVELVLETLERMGEGTRSAVANELPDETTVEYDAAAVVDLLQVLKRYGLVTLEGNTWKPNATEDE